MSNADGVHPLVEAILGVSVWRKLHPSNGVSDMPESIAGNFSNAAREFSAIKLNDIDPWLGKKICTIIRKSTTKIIYLDEDYRVQWWWIVQDDKSEIGYVQSQISRLEHESQFLKKEPEDERSNSRLLNIRILLGEAIAIALESGSRDDALRILRSAEDSIILAKDEYCKPIYLKAYLEFWVLMLLWLFLSVFWPLRFIV